MYLPNVLDGARSIPVTTGDQVFARAGTGVGFAVPSVGPVRGGLTFTYRIPYRLEHVYDVQTSGDTLEIGWSLEVSATRRLPTRSDDGAETPLQAPPAGGGP